MRERECFLFIAPGGLVFVCVYLRKYLVGRQWVGRPMCVCVPRWRPSGALKYLSEL